ncbi:MAG TPA: CHAD domain-containing protein [Bradyrhizobium sp.]|nr:CHAD domain-containing protein [Bradyrhizobium sp.]
MACDTAFRIIARRHLASLGAYREAAIRGDADALHEMRVALTHLRSAIRFFSPMVDDALKQRIWRELKWLNGELGPVRDLDVTIERIMAACPKPREEIPHLAVWHERRAEAYRRLAQALRSMRYQRLIAHTSTWVTMGPWSTMAAKRAIKRRAAPVTAYAADRLAGWEKKLLRRCRKLPELTAAKRHRVRLLNKRLTYSIESLADLLDDATLARQKIALKPLRKAQRCLGQLNDNVNGRRLARSLRKAGVAVPLQLLDARREKQLLQKAETAYRKLAALKLARK